MPTRTTIYSDAFSRRFAATADRFRSRLVARYGQEKGAAVKYAEAFEVCEYGRQPDETEIRRLFPFFQLGGDREREGQQAARLREGVGHGGRGLELFDRLRPETARKVAARYQINPDFLRALRQRPKTAS